MAVTGVGAAAAACRCFVLRSRRDSGAARTPRSTSARAVHPVIGGPTPSCRRRTPIEGTRPLTREGTPVRLRGRTLAHRSVPRRSLTARGQAHREDPSNQHPLVSHSLLVRRPCPGQPPRRQLACRCDSRLRSEWALQTLCRPVWQGRPLSLLSRPMWLRVQGPHRPGSVWLPGDHCRR